MKSNKEVNLEKLKEIVIALGELNEGMVFVGGAVVAIYANDVVEEDVRITKDIDAFGKITTHAELKNIREQLAKNNFFPSPEEKVICRFKHGEIVLDVMSTQQIEWAPANKWFEPGFEHLETVIVDYVPVKILSVPYFLATKFEAYYGRGKDSRTSEDFEDIVYILNNRATLVEDIENAPEDVKEYLISEFNKILVSNELREAVLVHLPYESQSARYKILIKKLETLTKTRK
jgi:predicted nucleotidyltransferase